MSLGRIVLGTVGAMVGSIFGPVGASIGWSIGSSIGGLIDGPGTIDGPKLGDAGIQTSRDGIPIPVAWGLCHIVGNIIQMNPIVEETNTIDNGKKAPSTTETRRYRTFGIGLGRSYRGPIIGVSRIWENDKLVYDTRPTPSIPAAETQAFAAGITIYVGGDDQLPEPDFEAHTGIGLTPAYRGLAYVVFHKKDITDFGSAIPTYRFEINAGGDFNGTSHIYPVEALDGIDITCAFVSGQINQIPHEAVDFTNEFVSGNINTILVDYSTGEAADFENRFETGNLRQILKETQTDEANDFANEFVSGAIRLALIETTLPLDGMDINCSFTSGTITPV